MGKEVQNAAKQMTPAWTDHSYQEAPREPLESRLVTELTLTVMTWVMGKE